MLSSKTKKNKKNVEFLFSSFGFKTKIYFFFILLLTLYTVIADFINKIIYKDKNIIETFLKYFKYFTNHTILTVLIILIILLKTTKKKKNFFFLFFSFSKCFVNFFCF
ncbi:hypothetical protein AshY1_00030 [Candidatus Phytoplasma fraxini]|uniref:Uncharacterized protein n=1 Tax=Ash yellows phytoplasma TaxID=35780 RepID=A0ABZ2UCV6_ASHYP